MLMRLGETWICSNPACGCVITVSKDGVLEGGNPRCSCGAALRKQYSSPVFQYLDFLRLDSSDLSNQTKTKG